MLPNMLAMAFRRTRMMDAPLMTEKFYGIALTDIEMDGPHCALYIKTLTLFYSGVNENQDFWS